MFYLTTHSVHLSYGYMASDVMVAMNYKHHCRVHSTVFGAPVTEDGWYKNQP